MGQNNEVMEIDLLEILMYYLRRWYLFLIVGTVTLVAGVAICLFVITPQYKSTTKIIILNQNNNGSLTYSDMQLASQLTKDYEELIGSRDVLEQVIRECGLSDSYSSLKGRTSIKNVSDTRIIAITVEDPSPSNAQMIANSIRETAAEHIRAVTDVEAVNIVEVANFPTDQSSPSLKKWAVISLGAGILIVLVILTIRFLADDTIKSSEGVEKYLGISTLALIPKMEADTGKKKSRRKKHSGAR